MGNFGKRSIETYTECQEIKRKEQQIFRTPHLGTVGQFRRGQHTFQWNGRREKEQKRNVLNS